MPEEIERTSLVYNEYELILPNQPAIRLGVTLEDLALETVVARFGRSNRAEYCGAVSIRGLTEGPLHPLIWIVRGNALVIVGRHGDLPVTDELRQVLGRLLGVFFSEIREIAPELSSVSFAVANGIDWT